MNARLPLVIILGATGSGKTKLSLELARAFGGEIIGADSMQVYKGLDIITAKATAEEISQAPHHLIDVLSPHECFTVVEYRNRAIRIIEDLFCRNKLPIVVGGTNYYIESLLWKILVEEPGKNTNFHARSDPNHELSSEELHRMLQNLDPNMAKRLHPNNKRKILRSLEVLKQKGRQHSEILSEQQNSPGGSNLGGGLRYDNSIVFWLQCDQKVLDERLDNRVDTMIQQGLLNELTEFHEQYNKHRISEDKEPDYTKGIFQSIGFKEFHGYLVLSKEEREAENGKRLFLTGLEQLKTVTRRYARKQIKWIRNRFLAITGRQAPPVYGLDTTDVSKWETNVSSAALEVVKSYIKGGCTDRNPLPLREIESQPNATDETFKCEVCDRVFIGRFQWNIHRKSNRHKRMSSKQSHKKSM